MFQIKVVEKIKTHILNDSMEQVTDDSMAQATDDRMA